MLWRIIATIKRQMLDSASLTNVMDMLPDAFVATLTPFNTTISAMMIEGARQRPAKRNDIEWTANIGLGLAERLFLLPVVNMTAGYEVVQNDLIADASGKKWNVMTASLEMEGTIWRCYARKAA